ncbi:MAG: TIGR02253 family HAD-type hydrolase [Candidatus Heimdallarchaeota archaeon]|nr:TIGR02253 family HAD-type hydrolase [Candidatus Heimdallarchaeota archaeon]
MTNECKFEAVFFDLDDTLFNSTLMSTSARRNAIRAMIEAGLDLEEEETFELLMQIVKEYGSNYGQHFNRLLESLGIEPHPKLIASAVYAYHSTKRAHLRPFPDVILTLLTLMKATKIGLISDGIKVKQWEKLIYLGMQHFFDVVIINDSPSAWKPAPYGFKQAMEKLSITDPRKTLYVGNKISTDIIGANRMQMFSVLFKQKIKKDYTEITGEKKPDFVISRISKLAEIAELKPIKWRF